MKHIELTEDEIFFYFQIEKEEHDASEISDSPFNHLWYLGDDDIYYPLPNDADDQPTIEDDPHADLARDFYRQHKPE